MTIEEAQSIRARIYNRLGRKDMNTASNIHPIIQETLDVIMKPQKFEVDLNELTIQEHAVLNTTNSAEFHHNLQKLQCTAKSVDILAERLMIAIDEAKDRICIACGGSGREGSLNDPNDKDCPFCIDGLEVSNEH